MRIDYQQILGYMGAVTAAGTTVFAFWKWFGGSIMALFNFAKNAEKLANLSAVITTTFTEEKIKQLGKIADGIPSEALTTLHEIAEQFRPNGGTSLLDHITQLKLLILSERKTTRAMFNAASLPFWESDPEGSFIYASSKLAQIIGMSVHEVLGSGWITNLIPEDRARISSEWDAAMKQKRRFIATCAFLHPTGEIVRVQVQSVPITDDDGHVVKHIGVLTPIK